MTDETRPGATEAPVTEGTAAPAPDDRAVARAQAQEVALAQRVERAERAEQGATEHLLEIEEVQTYYGNIAALKGVSLHVRRGEIVSLIGSNGAGKPTTLRTISGLLRPRHGRVRFDGHDIVGMPAHEIVGLGICQSPEGRGVFGRMSVYENLTLGAFTRHKENLEPDYQRVFELFPRLAERRTQKAGTLSGGEQQMLAMGRALMSRPQLLLLDEPSMGLSPILTEQIFAIISEINSQGTTILLVEQNAQMALNIAHRGYVLQTGRIILADTAANLAANEQVRQAYLGEI
jgi:branched-chain amino acid transport system ATP-binding protein